MLLNLRKEKGIWHGEGELVLHVHRVEEQFVHEELIEVAAVREGHFVEVDIN